MLNRTSNLLLVNANLVIFVKDRSKLMTCNLCQMMSFVEERVTYRIGRVLTFWNYVHHSWCLERVIILFVLISIRYNFKWWNNPTYIQSIGLWILMNTQGFWFINRSNELISNYCVFTSFFYVFYRCCWMEISAKASTIWYRSRQHFFNLLR
jgi:hypothetical protein